MLNLGTITVGIFSCIFLFYTNSFLIRRRKKEFGLYHILGMGKRNIARILFWETMLTAGISLVIGIGFGILFSKLAELGMFFIAVILVIVGTYLIMIAGSVLFCRLLQKNKRYYYKANHFVSVSSMVYRMKRNGAGLASICILATMVLVMLSTTVSLYFGTDDVLKTRYPREINTAFSTRDSFDHLSEFVPNGDITSDISTAFILIVPDVHAAIDTLSNLPEQMAPPYFSLIYSFDTSLSQDQQISLATDINIAVYDWLNSDDDTSYLYIESRAANYENFFADFGGLFYLAIVLSIVFLLAAVLIIYYKQISEGYEDQARFEIMQKVGMTKKEIRKSINSQLLTVFFLPLVGAGAHLIFAFPMIRKILHLFNLTNLNLFTTATLICFAVFAVFYTIVYRITSNAYYHIATR